MNDNNGELEMELSPPEIEVMVVEGDPDLDAVFDQRGGGHNRRRSSSFIKSNFGSLVQTDDDERELSNFFLADKQYIILTTAGKPLFSR
jgi:hypothetical protein